MKKGILMSIGMMMLAGLIFAFAILIFHNSQATERRFAELSLYDRFYDLDSSIGNGFKEIFSRDSGITLDIAGDTVSITETLPHSSELSTDVQDFADYIEGSYNINPLVTVTNTTLNIVKDKAAFNIMPHGITVIHSSFPNGNLEVVPLELNVENYTLSLRTTRQSVAFNGAGVVSGAFSFKVSVITSSGTSTWQDTVDATASNTLLLTFDSGLPTEAIMTITLTNPAHLLIDRNSVSADHELSILLQDKPNEMNYITLPEDLFTITFPSDNLHKSSTSRLL